MRGLLLAAMVLSGCADPNDAVRAAESMGFTEVVVTEEAHVVPSLYGCGQDDGAAFFFSAKNPIGKQVNAVACCSFMLKGCTVRAK